VLSDLSGLTSAFTDVLLVALPDLDELMTFKQLTDWYESKDFKLVRGT
jgi:anion-transporting  ArsA/GET3 family ATPase